MGFDLKMLRGWRLRRLIGAWLLLALVARSLIPAGFMPAAAKNGGVELVICTASLHLATGSPHHPDGKASHADIICPFAQSAGTAPIPFLAGVAAVVVANPGIALAFATPFVPETDLPRHHAPRGPPSLS